MRDLSELTTKMKVNLRAVGGAESPAGASGAVLSVGAAEHLIIRGLVRKMDTAHGVGRAKGLYRLTPAGEHALDNL